MKTKYWFNHKHLKSSICNALMMTTRDIETFVICRWYCFC